MSQEFVPGIGIVTIPDPINKSFNIQEPKSNGELASGGVDKSGTQTVVNPAQRSTRDELVAIAGEITKALTKDTTSVEKHETVDNEADHDHQELKDGDNEYTEDLDDEGNEDRDPLAESDVEFSDDLDDQGNLDADELTDVKMTKSKTPEEGQKVVILNRRTEAVVKSTKGNKVTVEINLSDVMPA